MASYKFVIFLLFVSVHSSFENSVTNKLFRSDYHYDADQNAFYKMHSMPSSWQEAVTMCLREGANLVYPSTKTEAVIIQSISNLSQLPPEQTFWVGASDLLVEGVFLTLEGVDLSLLYSKWAPSEPNNDDDLQHCIVMNPGLGFDDLECEAKLPYVCKKDLETLTWNQDCKTADLDYVSNEGKVSCYKVHTTPRSWQNAYATCHAEQSYLAIINSAAEAQFLTNLINQKRPADETVKLPYYNGHVAIGFHDLYREGLYLTIRGETLHDAGYDTWQDGEPNNYNGNDNCGSISWQGELNDISCTTPVLFICERDLGGNFINLRFSGQAQTN